MQIFVNGANLSRFLRSIDTSASVGEHDDTGLDATALSFQPGLPNATLSAEGFFAGGIRETDAIFSAVLGGASIWNWSDFGFTALETEYATDSPADGLVAISVSAQSNVARERVLTVAPLAVRTTTGNGTSFDNAGHYARRGGIPAKS